MPLEARAILEKFRFKAKMIYIDALSRVKSTMKNSSESSRDSYFKSYS